MKSPFFSVILPTYNRRETLRCSVESVLAQSYSDFELIIVDDASQDDTREYLQSLDDPRIKFIRHERNMHVSESRNSGVRVADGKWTVFLDDDDRMDREKLMRLYTVLSNSENSVTFIHHPVWIHYAQEKVKRISSNRSSKDYAKEILVENFIGGPNNVAVRTDFLKSTALFDTTMKAGEDYELWIRLAQRKRFVPLYLNEPLAHITIDTNVQSLDKEFDQIKIAFEYISDRHSDLIASLPTSMQRKRKMLLKHRLGVVCLHGRKRVCSFFSFLNAFALGGKAKYLGAAFLALFSPNYLLSLRHKVR